MSLEALTAEVAEKEAAGPLYTAASPGDFSAEKHVPKVSIADGVVTIVVPHGKNLGQRTLIYVRHSR
jgi:hypothetical protein